MNRIDKLNEAYNMIISEWNFSKDKTKLKCFWDEADELLSKRELIEKYVDYSDTNWEWNETSSDDENLINLYDALIDDAPNSVRVNFIVELLSDKGHMELQEKYNSKQEDEFIIGFQKDLPGHVFR
jgi:hypothetical protein